MKCYNRFDIVIMLFKNQKEKEGVNMKNNFLKKVVLILPALLLLMVCIMPTKMYAYASTCSHSAGVSVSTVPATCTERGKKIVKCSKCGKVLSTQHTTKSALGHSWKEETKQATETVKGYYKKWCTRCGSINTYKEYPKICRHTNNGQFEYDPKPTCTKGGVKVLKCTKCKVVMSRANVPALGHNWRVETKQATETVKGYYKKWCTRCGSINTYKEYPKICRHTNNGQFVYEKKPTCTKGGVKVLKCTKCKKVISRSKVKALGHNWTEKKVYPTKTAKGYYKKWCKRCKKVVKNTKYDVLKFICSKSTDPAVYTNGTVMFDAAGALNAKYQQCGRKVSTISAVKGKVIGTLKMSSNYNIIVESNASFVRFVNLKKNGSIVNQQGRITLGTDSKEFLYYCDKMPTSVTSRNAVITIKDQFGRKLKVINVKQANEKNGVVKVIKTQKSTSKRTQVDMEFKDQIYRYNGKKYTVRIVTCSPSNTKSTLYQHDKVLYKINKGAAEVGKTILREAVTIGASKIPKVDYILTAKDLYEKCREAYSGKVSISGCDGEVKASWAESIQYIYVKCGNGYRLGAIYSEVAIKFVTEIESVAKFPGENVAYPISSSITRDKIVKSKNWGNVELAVKKAVTQGTMDEHYKFYNYSITDGENTTEMKYDSNIYSDYKDYL